MKIIGLTGSIGMGKSTAAKMLRRLGVAVHCSDEAVHGLLGKKGGAVHAVAALFPEAFDGAAINRKKLGALVFADAKKLKALENILHPLVRLQEEKFLRAARRQGHRMVVLDIPLLFETGRAKNMDEIWVVSAPAFVQQARVLARTGMTAQRLAAILNKQMPDAQKRRKADRIIPTGLGAAHSFAVLRQLVNHTRR